jgi:asparagine synthase (glutamine-hydrolysing)
VPNLQIAGHPQLERALRLTAPGAMFAVGSPRFMESDLAELAARDGAGPAWVAAFERHDGMAPMHVHGDFAVAVRDHKERVFLAVDRFSIRTLCYRMTDGAIEAHPRADVVAGAGAEWDPQAIFNYLYFHAIPAPRTIFKGVHRLPAGHCAKFEQGRLSVSRWWIPVFVEEWSAPFDALRDEFRSLLRNGVSRQFEGNVVACFLSGGTDSSTVAGIAAEVRGQPPQTFSIGFDAEGYDEMAYARIAARHFRTDHHEYYVTPDDLVASIPLVATAYDQPFGNSSVVPAYHCALLARESGATTILGGDGGDELFGGNTRYAKQRLFGLYDHLPGMVRKGILEPALGGGGPIARLPIIRKAASYVEQARVPMPDRLQMYNLLAKLGMEQVLTTEFLSSVDTEEPLRQQRGAYAECSATADINKMLSFDWRYTLADNDLPKVVGATSLAGIHVGFPFLDDELVDFSLRLEPSLKLKGLKLRWFFKEALRGFLPEEIIAKKKHGFGLPFGVWVNKHGALKSLALDSVYALGQRGIVRPEFVDSLVREHLLKFPGYYGELVWVLMILEQWLQRPLRNPETRNRGDDARR